MSWGKRSALVGVATALVVAAIGATASATAPPRALSVRTMHVTVLLKVHHAAALQAFASAVSDPASPQYRDYLTPAEFGRRFGARADELAAVERSLRAHGLTPGTVPADRLSIPVSATVGQLEHAFHVALRGVWAGAGRRALIASGPPALDAAVAPDIQAVLGLSSLAPPRPLLMRPGASGPEPLGMHPRTVGHVVTGGPQPCSAAGSAASGQGAFTADQIASAYGLSGLYAAGDQGQGITIAEYELESFDPGDIAQYQACYGTSAPVTTVAVDGGAGTGAGSGEAALDIENAIGLAPRASIVVYEAQDSGQTGPGSGPYDLFSTIVNQDRAQVISVSWGNCERLQGASGIKAESTLFEQAAAQGQSIVAADGDNGSEDCNGAGGVPDPQLGVDDPSSQPFVTGVGGTSMSQPGPPPVESVWNGGGNPTGLLGLQSGASGGGVSAAWAMPGYQSGAASALHVSNANSSASSCGASSGLCREVPDVSADADPATGYIIYYNGASSNAAAPSGWQAVGGTSAAAPVWAAVLALVDASAACHGSPVGFANPALYHAAGANYAGVFNDVTSGNNDFTGTNGGLYPAGPGYDMTSGLGTPDAAALAPALCADSLRVADPGSQTGEVGQPANLQLRTTGPLTGSPDFVSHGLPPGLKLSRSGRVTGRPTKAGSFTVAVVVLDGALAIRGTVFTWTIHDHPTVSGPSLTGVGAGHPRLRLTVSAGRGAPALSRLVVSLPSGLSFRSAAVRITGPGGRRVQAGLSLAHGRLVVVLLGSPRTVTLVTGSHAIASSATIGARIRRRAAGKLPVGVTIVDTARDQTTLRVRVTPRG